MSETRTSKVTLEVRDVYQGRLDDLVKNQDCTIVMSYFGSFSQSLSSKLALAAEGVLMNSGDSKKVVKRIFSILTEGLRNVRLHGGKDDFDKQLGYLIVARNDDQYNIIIANIISPSECQGLKDSIELINSYSKPRMKENYVSILSNEFLTQNGGTGLGFVTARVKSGNTIKPNFYRLNNSKMLFDFNVNLDRELA